MGSRWRIEGGGVFPLPEVLIQHIQYFLSGKKAAQTSILSKSWFAAWSTRPNLDFDQRDFEIDKRDLGKRDDEGVRKFVDKTHQRFWEFVNKTVQRYGSLNLKIESFRLWLRYLPRPNCYLAEELIVKVMKMGVVDFNFEYRSWKLGLVGLDFEHETCNPRFTLPREVLESENLIRLYLNGCQIDTIEDRELSCPKLKFLSLNSTTWVDGDTNRDLISICPFIENLSLGLFSDFDEHSISGLEPTVDGLRSNRYDKLKSLLLGGFSQVDALFFSNLSSNFPCLKDLSLEFCDGYDKKEIIQLSSPSLECISFKVYDTLFKANFNVPNLRKFKFFGRMWPSLFFETPRSREWESDISISCDFPSTEWFIKLKEFLPCLRSSKISLYLDVKSIVEKKSMDFQCLPDTAVESMTIYAPFPVWFKVLECLLRSSRPKFINLIPFIPGKGTKGKVKNDFLEIVSKRNVFGVRQNCLMMNRDLVAVDVQFFGECLAERRHMPCQIQFRLGWRNGKA